MLSFANVLDRRAFEQHGPEGPRGVYMYSAPGRALPFVVCRTWSIGPGMSVEKFTILDGDGEEIYVWGPTPRDFRLSSKEGTTEVDVIDDAHFNAAGNYTVKFLLKGGGAGKIELPVMLENAPAKLPREIEDGLRRPDAIWVGTDERQAPSWFAFKDSKIYLLSQIAPGPQEQTVPGLSQDTGELLVVTKRKTRETSLDRFHASVRILAPGPEWEAAATFLVDRRRSRVGPPTESLARWRETCLIAELTPIIIAG